MQTHVRTFRSRSPAALSWALVCFQAAVFACAAMGVHTNVCLVLFFAVLFARDGNYLPAYAEDKVYAGIAAFICLLAGIALPALLIARAAWDLRDSWMLAVLLPALVLLTLVFAFLVQAGWRYVQHGLKLKQLYPLS